MTVFAIVVLGEAGLIFVRDLLAGGASRVHVFDVAFGAVAGIGERSGVRVPDSAASAVTLAGVASVSVRAGSVLDAIVSTVTAWRTVVGWSTSTPSRRRRHARLHGA